MSRFIAMRLLSLLPILLGASILVFSIIHMVPGDVVDIMIGDQSHGDLTAAMKLRKDLNLDKPVYVQYFHWLWNALRGDLGMSFTTRHPVLNEIVKRLPVNIELTLIALIFAVGLGIPIGVYSAVEHLTWKDSIIRVFSVMTYAIPNFWLATLVVLVGSLYIKSLPVLSYVPFHENPLLNMKFMVIPGFVLSCTLFPIVVRMTRASVLENLRLDYVRTAKAKGLNGRIILYRHVLKNSLIPVINIIGLQMGVLIGGLVLTEEVFVLPGVGRLMLEAIQKRDFMIITGTMLVITVAFVLITLLIDILHAYLDPRIRY
jgi:peptide/nickel transport system permease protein